MFNGKCRLDKTIICAVVKNMENCPYHSSLHCLAECVENWMGISNSFGSITLKRLRYSLNNKEISARVCIECRIIWTDSINKCPICKEE